MKSILQMRQWQLSTRCGHWRRVRQLLMMFSVAFILMIDVRAQPAIDTPLGVPIEFVKPEVASRRVSACGFKSARSTFSGELQEDVIDVMDVTFASPKKLRCTAVASLDTHYYVIFPAPLNRTYEKLYWRMSRERDKADASAWLAKRGLLSRLPTFDPKHSDEAVFAHKLEVLCGPKAVGTLQPMHGMATFKEGALGTLERGGLTKGRLDHETMLCLMNAAAVAGYPLGFIGNTYRQRP